MHPPAVCALVLVLALTIFPFPAAAQISTDLPMLSVGRTEQPPVIDGTIDDECWGNCIEAGNFALLSSGQVSTEPTEAYCCWDDESIYVAVRCHQTILDPVLNQLERFEATKTTRDADVWSDDCIELFMAPGQSRSGYYHIVVNALGTSTDRTSVDGQILCTTYSTEPDNRCLTIGCEEDRSPGTYSASQKNLFVEGGQSYRFSAHLNVSDAAEEAGEHLFYITAYDAGEEAIEKYTPLCQIDYSTDE